MEHVLTDRVWEADVDNWIYGKREKGVMKTLELKRVGLDADELSKKAEAARGGAEELDNRRIASPRGGKDAEVAAGASAATAASSSAGAEGAAKDAGGGDGTAHVPTDPPLG